MAWLTGWSHRKTVTITGQSGAGTDYQVNLSIGDASGGDFHLESHCTSFPNDIQVTDNDQTTPLDYWIEDLTADPITMWVEVSDDLGSNVDICVYYDKSGESSASNIGNTMLFGDDFEDGDVSDWTIQTGTGTIAADSVVKYAGSYSGKYTHDAGGGEEGVEKTVSLTTCILECNARPNSNTVSTFPATLWEGAQSGKGTYVFFGSAGQIQYYDTDFRNIQAYSGGTWYKIKLVIKSLAAYDIYIDDMNTPAVSDVAVRAGTPTSYGKVWIGGYNANGIINVDNIFIRKYNANEPAFSSAGSEENVPIVAIPVFMHHYGNLRET